MSWRHRAWRIVHAVRSIDRALTRREAERTILVDSRTPMNYVMVAPIQAAMATDPRVRFYAACSDAPAQASAVYRHAVPGTILVSPRRAAFMRFDAYLTADLLWAALPRGTRRILMFHGVAGKFSHDYETPTESMRRWDRLFFVNRRRMRNFVAAGALDPASGSPRLIGMPKVDCLVDGSLKRSEVLAGLGLDPGRPTVLYAPTWSAASSLNSMGVNLIEGLLARPWNVIVKLHDRSWDPRPFYSGGVDWQARLGALLAGKAARLARGADASPYLAAADVMITDHSSAGFEYLLLDRPLVRIHVPELLGASNAHPEYVRLLAEAAVSVSGPGAAIDAVERGLADPREGSASRRAVAEDLFYRPGTATARAVEELYGTLELQPMARRAESRADRRAAVLT